MLGFKFIFLYAARDPNKKYDTNLCLEIAINNFERQIFQNF